MKRALFAFVFLSVLPSLGVANISSPDEPTHYTDARHALKRALKNGILSEPQFIEASKLAELICFRGAESEFNLQWQKASPEVRSALKETDDVAVTLVRCAANRLNLDEENPTAWPLRQLHTLGIINRETVRLTLKYDINARHQENCGHDGLRNAAVFTTIYPDLASDFSRAANAYTGYENSRFSRGEWRYERFLDLVVPSCSAVVKLLEKGLQEKFILGRHTEESPKPLDRFKVRGSRAALMVIQEVAAKEARRTDSRELDGDGRSKSAATNAVR